MILYLVHDSTKLTYSHPLIGPDEKTVIDSFVAMNPENLSDLSLVILDHLNSEDDLLNLRLSSSPVKEKLIKFSDLTK